MQISFEPYNKLSFRSYLEYASPEDLVRNITSQLLPGMPARANLRWSNGVLFTTVGYQPTDSITKEYVSGHLLWDHIDFAVMPKYQKEITVPESPMVVMNILDLSSHSLFGPLGEWIRANLARVKTQRSADHQ